MAVTVMRLERALAKHPENLAVLSESVRELAPMLDQVEAGTVDICAQLAKVYCDCLSPLKPRVMVDGNPDILGQAAHVHRIRALLLAAIRAVFLWRQLGGSQWRLLFRHRQYAMLARGLLTRCTLDGA
jgi:high frequency lysogenization protein